MVILGDESVERGGTMAPITSLAIDLVEHACRRHAAPKIALVYRMTEDVLVRLLKISQCERLGQEMEGDVGIAELCPEPHLRIVEHLMVEIIVQADIPDQFPLDIGQVRWISMLPEEGDVPNDHVTFRLPKAVECVELLEVVAFISKSFADNPARGEIQGFISVRPVLEQLDLASFAALHGNFKTTCTEAQWHYRHQQMW